MQCTLAHLSALLSFNSVYILYNITDRLPNGNLEAGVHIAGDDCLYECECECVCEYVCECVSVIVFVCVCVCVCASVSV
jgi:hypothetical protein